LITLGIIGVVAALTMPTLIHNYRVSTYEAGFKKLDSVIEQASLRAKYDLGVDDFAKFAVEYTPGAGYPNVTEAVNAFFKYMPIVTKLKNEQNIRAMNFTNTAKTSIINGFFAEPPMVLKDGSRIYVDVNSKLLYILFDTNGLKGPNRMGYDVFLKVINADKGLAAYNNTPATCSFTSTDAKNGFGCYYFARANSAPDGSEKGYWKSLKR